MYKQKHEQYKYILHFVKLTDQLLFKTGFPKNGQTFRWQMVNSRRID